MANNSRIRFNPVTKEIEVEGTEQFVKTYFGKLQAMLSGAAEKKAAIKKEPKAAKGRPARKSKKAAKKVPGKKRITNRDSVIGLIQGSAEGIFTAELKKKTGLPESQIWNIVNHAAKEGKIRKIKRGLYGAVAAS
jgi:uncharacterized membrane protein